MSPLFLEPVSQKCEQFSWKCNLVFWKCDLVSCKCKRVFCKTTFQETGSHFLETVSHFRETGSHFHQCWPFSWVPAHFRVKIPHSATLGYLTICPTVIIDQQKIKNLISVNMRFCEKPCKMYYRSIFLLTFHIIKQVLRGKRHSASYMALDWNTGIHTYIHTYIHTWTASDKCSR